MMKTLEWWISQIQYQALSDNYLTLPGDWADQIEVQGYRLIRMEVEDEPM